MSQVMPSWSITRVELQSTNVALLLVVSNAVDGPPVTMDTEVSPSFGALRVELSIDDSLDEG